VKMAVMAMIGVLVGTQVNRGIYRLAWFRRDIGPWSAPSEVADPRTAWDRVPIFGWWRLRRESRIHGRGFWIRPLLLEIGMGIGFAVLYWYEIEQVGVFTVDRYTFVPRNLITPEVLHLQLLSHLVLISLMMVATFIDFDEQTIPDAITIPGTLLGLTIASLFPQSRAIVSVPGAIAGRGYIADFLHLCSGTGQPGMPDWPQWLHGPKGLCIGLFCFVGWCVAIIPWTWTTRRGLFRAVRYWFASIPRRAAAVPIGVMAICGSMLIMVAWYQGGIRWESLLSALVGMAVGGGTIWAVRIVGSAALQQEAMGFGDVTLMAMIGAFTGWQPTLIIFFLAPFSAVLIAVAQFTVSRRHDIAFGPYLCLSALIWILCSGTIWSDYGLPIFGMGWFVPAIGASGLFLMGGMLKLWGAVRDAIFPYVPEADETSQRPAFASAQAGSIEEIGSAPPVRSANCEHPLRKAISLQPPRPPIPGTRQLGQHPPGSQLFRR
jgi:leader peptidase (prepilin peptidase) / N-methyltransferase